MDGIEFTPCANPTRGILAATATLAVTLVALRALDQLKSPLGWAAAGTLPTAVGILASSLDKAKGAEERDDDQTVTLPAMQDNVLAPQWSAEQCEQFKALYNAEDGALLREAALSGTIDMVRWCLEKAFTEDRSHYDVAFQGSLPQFNNAPLPHDLPIATLHRLSGEPRFEPVANLLAEVRKLDAHPDTYVVLNTLPEADQQLLTQIHEGFQRGIQALTTKYPNMDPTEAIEICRGLGFKEDFSEELERLPIPVAEWNDRTRALFQLHSAKRQLPLQRLTMVAQAQQTDLLERMITSRAWHTRGNLTADQAKRLRTIAKGEWVVPLVRGDARGTPWDKETCDNVKTAIANGDNDGLFLKGAALSCSRELVEHIIRTACKNNRFELIDNADIGYALDPIKQTHPEAKVIQYFLDMVAYERKGRSRYGEPRTPQRIDQKAKLFVDEIQKHFGAQRQAEAKARQQKVADLAQQCGLSTKQMEACLKGLNTTADKFDPAMIKTDPEFPTAPKAGEVPKELSDKTKALVLLQAGSAKKWEELSIREVILAADEKLLLELLSIALRRGFLADEIKAAKPQTVSSFNLSALASNRKRDLLNYRDNDFDKAAACQSYQICHGMMEVASALAKDSQTTVNIEQPTNNMQFMRLQRSYTGIVIYGSQLNKLRQAAQNATK